MKPQGRPADMKLEVVYTEVTPEEMTILKSLKIDHPNDYIMVTEKDKVTINTRLPHWLNWVEYLLATKCGRTNIPVISVKDASVKQDQQALEQEPARDQSGTN